MFRIDGLVSGLDTSAIVEGLLAIRQSQIDRLALRRQQFVNKQTAFKGIEARLLTLRGALGGLAAGAATTFSARRADSSDTALVEASAAPGTSTAVYQFRVQQLAAAHRIASQALTAEAAEITQGTLTIRVGARAPVTLTVDSQNNSLSALAQSINSASPDVFASVVQDAGGYRLLISSKTTGADQTISITNNLAASSGTATRPDFSGPPVQAAADALVIIGDGAGAITVTSSTNEVRNLANGLILSLRGADAAKTVTVTVQADTEVAQEAVQNFVTAFNDLMAYVDEQSSFDSETRTAGLLLGNFASTSIQDQIRALANSTVADVNPLLNRLSAVGVTFTSNGRLTVDAARLQRVLAGQEPGISEADVRRLFALAGQSTSSGIEFVRGSLRTVASSTPYEIEITQAAEQATIVGTNKLQASVVIDATNDRFSLSLDGQASGDLALTHGTYTRAQLAAHLQEVIRSAAPLGGSSVDVILVDDALQIRSAQYGTASQISALNGTALTALGFAGTESDTGQNVGGHFIVDGLIEAATGAGQMLTGGPDNASTADLAVRVTLSAAQIGAGPEGEISVSRGIAAALDKSLNDLLDPFEGRLKTTADQFDDQVESVDVAIQRLNALFEAQQETLLERFAALESTLSRLQATNNILVNQLAQVTLLNRRV